MNRKKNDPCCRQLVALVQSQVVLMGLEAEVLVTTTTFSEIVGW